MNYSHINIKKEANKEIKQTNELKGDKTELRGQNCTEENYYSFWLLLLDWCIYLHTCNYSLFVKS